jgi:hypothetical protein
MEAAIDRSIPSSSSQMARPSVLPFSVADGVGHRQSQLHLTTFIALSSLIPPPEILVAIFIAGCLVRLCVSAFASSPFHCPSLRELSIIPSIGESSQRRSEARKRRKFKTRKSPTFISVGHTLNYNEFGRSETNIELINFVNVSYRFIGESAPLEILPFYRYHPSDQNTNISSSIPHQFDSFFSFASFHMRIYVRDKMKLHGNHFRFHRSCRLRPLGFSPLHLLIGESML